MKKKKRKEKIPNQRSLQEGENLWKIRGKEKAAGRNCHPGRSKRSEKLDQQSGATSKKKKGEWSMVRKKNNGRGSKAGTKTKQTRYNVGKKPPQGGFLATFKKEKS